MNSELLQPTIMHPLPDNDDVRVCHYQSVDALDDDALERWRDLSQNAIHRNVYLSPDFLIPALRHLPDCAPYLIAVSERRSADGWESIGLGVFNIVQRTRAIPFPHLATLRTPHSFLGGLLLRAECIDLSVQRFFADIVQCDVGPWRALAVKDFPLGELLSSQHLALLRKAGVNWLSKGEYSRASIHPSKATAEWPGALVSRNTVRNYARKLRKLGGEGTVSHRLLFGDSIDDACIEQFLALENTGFRRSGGTSLLAHESHERFFREMISRLRDRDGAFFSELLVGDKVIASTCNLLDGPRGFAFKLGWDPAYADFSPGAQNELALVAAMASQLSHIEHMDSGAVPGSFMERLWPERDVLVDGIFTCDQVSHWVARSIRLMASVRDRWRNPK